MHLKFRNVNDAFRGMVRLFLDPGHYTVSGPPLSIGKVASRYGECLSIEEPMTLTYSHPRERVLFNAARDANPFSLLYEALWALAGRNDVEPLAYYTPRFREFSDDEKTLNGAYGYRWRNARCGPYSSVPGRGVSPMAGMTDQLRILIDHLRAEPSSRRAVLDMWNVEDDLLKIEGRTCPTCRGRGASVDSAWREGDRVSPCVACDGSGKLPASKDVCCNLSVKFRVVESRCPLCDGEKSITDMMTHEVYRRCPQCSGKGTRPRLDMTVFNRSNDLVWGALGANYVGFTILQEYVAAHLGVPVGSYNQISDDLHAYSNTFKGEEWSVWESPEGDSPYNPLDLTGATGPRFSPFPLVRDSATFDREVVEFVERHGKDSFAGRYSEPFLEEVAQPMSVAFHHYKNGHPSRGLAVAEKVAAADWRRAAVAWLGRRAAARAAKTMEFMERYGGKGPPKPPPTSEEVCRGLQKLNEHFSEWSKDSPVEPVEGIPPYEEGK